ncbi:uncharacterized protein EURHEDRAFT_364594 [Aspergillus ruber CBS 135680]|uniref:Transmembrane protein n=1 Tax=Aspergillus ruber (strain CBS 135680) TaxID=1388766 RepID=A0A017SGT5_ASPRC|nr:uncharacterized protein EURHEDRAFT_364594 [Aspergillus ruber CBS 135680]EYE96183.1 hypothetical protein EURHEDRAFT_364594 [Aspergillus ruber CBS 135680]
MQNQQTGTPHTPEHRPQKKKKSSTRLRTEIYVHLGRSRHSVASTGSDRAGVGSHPEGSLDRSNVFDLLCNPLFFAVISGGFFGVWGLCVFELHVV